MWPFLLLIRSHQPHFGLPIRRLSREVRRLLPSYVLHGAPEPARLLPIVLTHLVFPQVGRFPCSTAQSPTTPRTPYMSNAWKASTVVSLRCSSWNCWSCLSVCPGSTWRWSGLRPCLRSTASSPVLPIRSTCTRSMLRDVATPSPWRLSPSRESPNILVSSFHRKNSG